MRKKHFRSVGDDVTEVLLCELVLPLPLLAPDQGGFELTTTEPEKKMEAEGGNL